MAALAKKKTVDGASAWRGRGHLRAAHEADQPQDSAVHRQRAMLEAAFSEASVRPYPAPVRLAVLVGAPLALWIGIFTVVSRIFRG